MHLGVEDSRFGIQGLYAVFMSLGLLDIASSESQQAKA